MNTTSASALRANQQLAREAVELAATAASFCNDNILPVMAAIVELATINSQDIGENRMRIGLIADLAKVGRQLVEEAAGHMESEVEERQSALDRGLSLDGGAQ